MLSFEEMLLRLGFAVLLGAIIGLERELVGKEAGIRTNILVAAGAALFTIIGLTLAHSDAAGRVIANIVVGIGFLGAGIIIKHGVHVRGLTTAGVVWFTAAIGTLSGLGFYLFAGVAAVAMTLILVFLRKINLFEMTGHEEHEHQNLE